MKYTGKEGKTQKITLKQTFTENGILIKQNFKHEKYGFKYDLNGN